MASIRNDITPRDEEGRSKLFPGATFTLDATFTNEAGSGITAARDDITLVVLAPDGTKTEKTGSELTEEGSGKYSFDFPISTPGRHFASWKYDGPNDGVLEIEFHVVERIAA